MHLQVVHRNDRQVELEGLPGTAAVEGDEHSAFGPGVEQPRPDRILTNDLHEFVGW